MDTKKLMALVRRRAELKRELRLVEQELCPHKGETYRSVDWTYDVTACSNCHKTLIDHRKG